MKIASGRCAIIQSRTARWFLRSSSARVAVRTRDGRTLKREILHRRGSPENPLKPADVEYKFRNVARACLSRSHTDQVMKLVGTLETLTDVAREFGAINRNGTADVDTWALVTSIPAKIARTTNPQSCFRITNFLLTKYKVRHHSSQDN